LNARSNRPDLAAAASAVRPVPAWCLAALLGLATLALYWPALQNGFVNYDDDRYVTANSRVQAGLSVSNLGWAFITPVAGNWHPLTVLSHMLVCQLGGLNPWPHHLVNVLLHAANAVLVFVLLRQLTGSRRRSFVVAALFAVHPLRVESVAWVAERKDVLSGFFGLLALILYARHARRRDVPPGAGALIRSGAYWLALVFFVLGLMSKPMLVTWPFVLLLLDYWPLGRISSRSLPFLMAEKIPFLVLSAAVSVITFQVQRQDSAVETIQNLPVMARAENALISLSRYLGKTFWPTDLAVLYPYPDHWSAAVVIVAATVLLGVSAFAVSQRGRQPWWLTGWLWYLGTLIPVIGLVQVGLQSMADRYTYLPSLGIGIALVWTAEALTRTWRRQALVLAAVSAIAVALCAIVTRRQLGFWRDSETLWQHTIAVTADNPIACYNLGTAFDAQGRIADAISAYQAMLKLQPDSSLGRLNLGADLDKSGDPSSAAAEYEQVIRLDPDNAKAHNNMGIVLFNQGRTDAAIREFKEAVRLLPDSAETHNSLAAALYTHGEGDAAIQQFRAALQLKPDYAEAHFNLGCVLARAGQTNEAIGQLREAVRLKPGYSAAQERLAGLLNPTP
jgi:Flp pilus assembly protein TadD